MLVDWVYIGIFVFVALIVPAVAILIPVFIAPRKPSQRKREVYECGIETVGETQVQFKAQYYLFALIFLVFDVEVIFLYPWAVSMGRLGIYAILEGILFIVILLGGLFYAKQKGVLEWN